MDLQETFATRRTAILGRWKELTLATYPEQSARFLRAETDRFRNPVGHAIGGGLEALLDGVLSGQSAQPVDRALDAIVRIRAVQDLAPSEAVAFVLALKRAVRDEVAGDASRPAPTAAELFELDCRVDRLALRAFDRFMGCREQLYRIRAADVKRRAAVLLERAAGMRASAEPSTGHPVEEGGCDE